jgi:acyl transferase domain-containing protein/thioesterase domain-containing protein/acyl carrier protein
MPDPSPRPATDQTTAPQHDTHPHGAADIAIVGMAARLPGADTVEAYWNNLVQGISAIRPLDRETLIANGEAPHLVDRPDYVPFAAELKGYKAFDPEFFGFSPKEAAILDPQHRQFLEVSWEALENAAHMPENFDGSIGVFGGCGMGSYFYFNICSNRDLVDDTGMFLLRHTGNDKDFMTTRLSHVLDLKGPSVNVQTACSTSLVATHYACQSLLNGECDMALAGGVTIELPQGHGYLFKEGEILSPDGECHAFDHRAQGTVFGSGAGVVVLRRLEDAVADGDHIWAVIKSTAVNNDGAAKAGYLAPSVDGQANAVADAHALADISADTIDYVECHGTGTYLGDPIEVAALTEAFRETTDEVGFCRIGSVKTNIGHLDTAAGVASLIKTSLSLHNRKLPASLGYEAPNPAIDFDGSPFQVNNRLQDWVSHKGPRRAGVNSLGVGGTNAHAVLEEAPMRAASEEADFPFQILTLSARNKKALEAGSERLSDHLRTRMDQPLADVAYTLKEGRRAFEQRRVVVAETHAEAADLLAANDRRRVFTHTALDRPEVVFMFPGGGAQYAGMARDLYEVEPVFADWMDRGLDHLQAKLDYDIRALWLPEVGEEPAADEALKQPSVQLPLIMITEYALAQLWISWGVRPAALVGHSMGENTAACLAGVIGFTDCIDLVHLRGQLFDTVPTGGMLSVALPAEELRGYLGDDLDLASVNAPGLSVATGPRAELDQLRNNLQAQDIDCQDVAINIAAHSRMLDPILDRFRAFLQGLDLRAPQIPFASNRTGQMITDQQATDPNYWVDHLRHTVLFADCIATLDQTPDRVFLEVGPGKALSSLTQAQPDVTANRVISTLRHPQDDVADDVYFATMLGRLWAVGVDFDWGQFWGNARRNRVVLPSYAWQHQDYFIEPAVGTQAAEAAPLMRRDDMDSWGYRPVWAPRYADCTVDVVGNLSDSAPQTWLIFADDAGYAAGMTKRLRLAGHTVTTVRSGDRFAAVGDDFILAPEQGRAGYDQLIAALAATGRMPDRIVHLWLTTKAETYRPGSTFFHRNLEYGFDALLHLTQALAEQAEDGNPQAHLTVITSGAMQVRDEALPYPEKSTVLGPARVMGREYPDLTCAVLDLDLTADTDSQQLSDALLEEVLAKPANQTAALRGGKRFEQQYGPTPLPSSAALPNDAKLRQRGTYMITGGFGGIGLTIAETLIKTCDANIVLLSRSALPDRAKWPDYLRSQPGDDIISKRIRAIMRLDQLGSREILILPADVTNIEDMRQALGKVRNDVGDIHGVIHAAGVIHDGPIASKTSAEVEQVFAAKLHGTQVLDQLFPDGSLDWMVVFASSSTATAPAGQVDYVAANSFLNAFAAARAGRKTRTLALNWGVWAEVGMAADAMAARNGPAHPRQTAPTGTPIAQPLLKTVRQRMNGALEYQGTLSVADWVMDEHRTKGGVILLPGTGYLELIQQSLAAQDITAPYAIRDLIFLAPLVVTQDEQTQLRVTLTPDDASRPARYDVTIESARASTIYDLNAEARIDLILQDTATPLDMAAITSRCGADGATDASGDMAERPVIPAPQEAHLNFGPRWKVLRAMALAPTRTEGLAHLALPKDLHADLDAYTLHPGLMDIATGWAMQLIADYQGDHLWVPIGYQRVTVHAPLQPTILSWVRNAATNTRTDETASFDITLVAPDGTVLVEVEGLSIRRMTAGLPTAKPASQEEAQRPLSPAEERLQHNIRQGIRPSEGGQAFLRALAQPLSQIYISSMDLDALISEAAEPETTNASSQSFDRPELDADYAAPESVVEKELAGYFQDLLGISQVGLDDSFFDLGGHSLIAVRLFSRIKKHFGSDFPISLLFEAPTVRKIAALLPAENAEIDAAATTTPQPAQNRYTHLVPMSDGGTSNQATPLFLVAGMFGNVLNLRHLATLLGQDRPVYGLQARGLFGDAPPHSDITDAARDYIAELRQVQPHGPYLLGGFSGGGITAYEMAQQLMATGEQVEALVLLDTPLPQRRPLSLRDRMAIQAMNLRRHGPAYLGRWVTNRLRWELEKRRVRTAEDDSATPQFHNAAIEAGFLTAVAKYQVAPWSGPITLIRPPLRGEWQVAPDRLIDHERAYVLHDNDWGQWTPQIEVYEVPGDHDSMVLEPNVRVLSTHLRTVLADADRHTTRSKDVQTTTDLDSRKAAE